MQQLDWWAQMNDTVDGKAKSYLKGYATSNPPKPLTQPRATLYQRGKTIDRQQEVDLQCPLWTQALEVEIHYWMYWSGQDAFLLQIPGSLKLPSM